MSISSRITEMEDHIRNAYDKIEDLGIDTTNTNKNINNISSILETVWNEQPKVLGQDTDIVLKNTRKGKMNIKLNGNIEQEQLTGKNLLNTSISSLTFETDNVNRKNVGYIDLIADQKYYISYTVNNATSSNERNTPNLTFNGSNYYEFSGKNYNLTAGRKVWEFTPTETGEYLLQYWCHTPNVIVTISDFMISTSSDIVYEPYCRKNTCPKSYI